LVPVPIRGRHLLNLTAAMGIIEKVIEDENHLKDLIIGSFLQKEVHYQVSTPEVPVKITVKTTIDQDESFELSVFGRYFQRDNADYLQYVEAMEEGSVRTIVKMSAKEALILRSGAVKMRLPFEVDRKLNGSYELPFGEFATVTNAKKLDYSYENGKGSFTVLYDFVMEGSAASTYHLEIAFQEEKNEHS
jgi:uncharacterized beta-barrel protein YwiB (DUF1934 family)